MTDCSYCKGPTNERPVTYTTEFRGRVVVVENVPACVCEQCGEPTFRPDVVDKLQQIAWGRVEHTGEMNVPLYDYEKVA